MAKARADGSPPLPMGGSGGIGSLAVVGVIVLIVFAVQDSQPGANAYGPNPKAAPVPPPVAA